MATICPPEPGKSCVSLDLTPASQVDMSFKPDQATLFFAFSMLPLTKKSLTTPLTLNLDGTVPEPLLVTKLCKVAKLVDVPIK